MFSWYTYEGRAFVWHPRKTIYAHAPFRFLRKFFLLCFGHLFGVMVCIVCHSSLRQTVRPSVCLFVCLSQPLWACFITDYLATYYQMIRNTYCFWLPNIQGHMANFKVTQAKKNPVKRIQSRVFEHFLENAWGKGLECHILLYPDHRIRFWSRSVDFTNFGGILTPMNHFKCVVPVFDEEIMTVVAWNLACRYILTTLRTA